MTEVQLITALEDVPEVELLGVHENFQGSDCLNHRRAYYFGCDDIAFGWTSDYLGKLDPVELVGHMREYVKDAQRGDEPSLPREDYSFLFGPMFDFEDEGEEIDHE